MSNNNPSLSRPPSVKPPPPPSSPQGLISFHFFLFFIYIDLFYERHSLNNNDSILEYLNEINDSIYDKIYIFNFTLTTDGYGVSLLFVKKSHKGGSKEKVKKQIAYYIDEFVGVSSTYINNLDHTNNKNEILSHSDSSWGCMEKN